MAAELSQRCDIQIIGLGEDKKASYRNDYGVAPTQAGGPNVVTVGTVATLIDIAALISGQLVSLLVQAKSGSLCVSPFATTVVVSASCYISEGNWNYYTFKATVSAIPSVLAISAGSQMEYIICGVS